MDCPGVGEASWDGGINIHKAIYVNDREHRNNRVYYPGCIMYPIKFNQT